MKLRFTGALCVAVMAVVCLSGCLFAPGATAGGNAPTLGGDRPAAVFLPSKMVSAKRGTSEWERERPLVILLHGFTSNGDFHTEYFRLAELVDEKDFVLVVPDGTQNSLGLRFWNATSNCCDFEAAEVDDVGYVSGLIDEAISTYNVDPSRVYLFGHSNGGFMAHSIACEHADKIAGVVSVASSTYTTVGACAPTSPVPLLHAHGTLDPVIRYDGGVLVAGSYPSAMETASRWARYNRCSRSEHTAAVANFLQDGFSDTDRQRWTGCERGAQVELLTLHGGEHRPSLVQPRFSRMALDRIFEHDKPRKL